MRRNVHFPEAFALVRFAKFHALMGIIFCTDKSTASPPVFDKHFLLLLCQSGCQQEAENFILPTNATNH
ncbi:Alpha-1-acid glycoprotein [Trichinella spiralis]|uniref:Alpha-1-acid glycoprotein n=1 Tax=Trichinella spiralis TaxID=6334 RepID=A0ABR3K8Q9_TRISP